MADLKSKKNLKWDRVHSLAQACELIDEGILVKWSEIKTLNHHIPHEQHVQLVEYLATSICKTTRDRLRCEVSVETLLLWLAGMHADSDLKAVISQLFRERNAEEGILKLVEISLTGEISDVAHQEAAYAAAVMLTCLLAKTIEQKERDGEEAFAGSRKIVPHITTYLLSVSNLNDYVIRLSLLHYFGYMAGGGKNQAEFERLLNRFGYTVLDFLFSLLFTKKSESIALQYLLDNFSHFLEASVASQRIIHEILKFYLLKKPERCSLFLQTLGDNINAKASMKARQSYLQHLGALLHVVGTVHHKNLTREILACIYKSQHPFISELSVQIQNEETLGEEEKSFARNLEESNKAGKDSVVLHSHKRGRHPSFHLSNHLEAFEQVALLGSVATLGRVT